MKIFYENMNYDISLDFDDEDPSTCTFDVTCDRMDLVTIDQDVIELYKFNIAIGTLDDEIILVKFAYTVTDIFSNANTTYEYIILRVFNNINNVRYFTKQETDNILVPVTEYEDLAILAKILNVGGNGSELDADLLDGYNPSEEPLPASIPISDDSGRLDVDWTYLPPVINNISWDDDNHFQDSSYVLTINASDPGGTDLTYMVEYNLPGISITPRLSFPHIFDIIYDEYVEVINVILTVTVTNQRSMISQCKEYITVNTFPPIIDEVAWNPSGAQYENNSYVMTITAHDPGGLDLNYIVECNNASVGIDYRGGAEKHIIDITYGEYNENTNVIFTVKVFNTTGIFIIEEFPIIINNYGPVINNITWDPSGNHFEEEAYTMTIDVQNPGDVISYAVGCNDGTVDIAQRSPPNEHMFNVTYIEYDEDVNIEYTITVIDSTGTTITHESIIVKNYNPKINFVAWNDSNHFENNSYVMTIGATDPLGSDLTYAVECDPPAEVTITPQPGVGYEHIFNITYGEFNEHTDLTYMVTVENPASLTDVEYYSKTVQNSSEAPDINAIVWDDPNHFENNSYTMTISTDDPNNLFLSYEVECNPPTGVTITPTGQDHVFTIAYSDFIGDEDVIFTITVENTDSLVTTVDEPITIHHEEEAPSITGIDWDVDNHIERTSYVMTINAIDPNELDLTYTVECNYSTPDVIIAQQSSPNEHMFNISYGEFIEDTNVTFTITATNDDELFIEFEEVKNISNIDPIITGVDWDTEDQWENESYVMTINATDPNSLGLIYAVESDHPSLVTIDSPGNDNVFNINYSEVASDTNVLFTIIVTNTASDSTIGNELMTVQNANPNITGINWNDNNQFENHPYIMTVEADDPRSQTLTYTVDCNYSSPDVIIAQQSSPNEHMFNISYGEFIEDTDVTFTITVENTASLETEAIEIVSVQDTNPIVNDIIWSHDSNDQFENNTYVMTIDAIDPQSQNLTYDVVCNPPTGVTINSPGNDHIYNITYGDYNEDTPVTFTITVTNEEPLSTDVDEPIIIHNTTAAPNITNIVWDVYNQFENHQYEMTINATDPNNQDLTYAVVCNDGSVIITPRTGAESHIFDINYVDYDENANVTYTITVTNEEPLSDTYYEPMTIHYEIEPPDISNFTWNPSGDHWENNTYEITIDATDPNNQDLSYGVICDPPTGVTITPRAGIGNEHIFDIVYDPFDENTNVEYIITVTNDDTFASISDPITIHSNNPVINTISWDNNNHFENESYVMTIDTTDPNSQDLTYEVVCTDGSVGIVQRTGAEDHIFDITYGEYDVNTDITYTITVTNTDSLTDTEDEIITVYYIQEAPVINTISWDNNNHIENESYVMTIDTTDPNNQDLTYEVVCTDGSVGVVQRIGTEDHIFDITYGDYDVNTDITYTITVTNTDSLTDTEDEIITVQDANRGVFTGGSSGSSIYLDTIEYINISAATGSVTDFGDLSVAKSYLSATSNGTNDRGVFAGGYDDSTYYDTIEYITISAATGSVTYFGDLSTGKYGLAATSNGTNDRGVFAGGYDDSTYYDTIEYITISAATGSVTDFGDLSTGKTSFAATSNGTNDRGVFAGGYNGNNKDVIEYINISAATGSVTDFGDLSTGRRYLSATSNGTNNRGVFAGGYNFGNINVIEYINISAATGSVTDFGDLSVGKRGLAATSNGTNDRCVFAGGYTNNYINVIEYINISAATGSVTDFGNLSVGKNALAATSDA